MVCSFYERPTMAKRYYEEESNKGGMLSADTSAVANMPQTAKYHAWSSADKYIGQASPELNDSITGINAQTGADVSQARKHRSKSKY